MRRFLHGCDDMGKNVEIYDCTLRDGAQAEGISFSVQDKLRIAQALDDIGVAFIEGGNPCASQADMEFFRRAKSLKLKNAVVSAFGSTRRKGVSCEDDVGLAALLAAETRVCSIFGKSWDLHVENVLGASLSENLLMIERSVSYLKGQGRTVVYDAEHFFDGYFADEDYAIQTIRAAARGGADVIALCDTNGGAFPDQIGSIVARVASAHPDIKLGIHAHNDGELAVANTCAAAFAGCVHIQGTFTGFGERCGNVSLASVIANLQLKRGYICIPEDKLCLLAGTARLVADVANDSIHSRTPYIGRSAFAHKAGMHIDAMSKSSRSYEHIPPEAVGNSRRKLTSGFAGRSAIISLINRIAPDVLRDSDDTSRVLKKLKELSAEGYEFESADASIDIIIRKALGVHIPRFTVLSFKAFTEKYPKDSRITAGVMIKVDVGGKEELAAAEGEGPVHALDKALRKALKVFYPCLSSVRLTDFKVRVLDGESATAAAVRVLVESTDGKSSWTTVGVSRDIIEASLLALVDAIDYKLIMS